MLYVFGDYTLDTQRCEVQCAGQPVHVRAKVFQVLVYLLTHRDRVVPKQELCEQLWPTQFISDATLDSCMAEARRAVGDSLTAAPWTPETHAGSAAPPGPLAPLPPPLPRSLAGEQKLVTVLVGTLAPAWTQELAPEARHQAMQAWFALLLQEVQRYGGTLQRVEEDGGLALFGAP